MATCAACGTTILFGGKTAGQYRFCNDQCQQNGYVLQVAQELPPDAIIDEIIRIYDGACPACKGPGPVDAHASHRIWSLIFMTNWSSPQHVCCRKCATKAQVGDLFYCVILGWWGVPWGILGTPVQVCRNLAEMTKSDKGKPSPALEELVRIKVASQMLMREQEEAARAKAPAA